MPEIGRTRFLICEELLRANLSSCEPRRDEILPAEN